LLLDAIDALPPLRPGLPDEAARRAVVLPDIRLLPALAEAAGLVRRSGTVQRPGPAIDLGRAAAAVAAVEQRLAKASFDAPAQEELADIGLGRAEQAAAEAAGRLWRVAPDLVLLPGAAEQAHGRLRALPQRFTTSAAREALGTTRRVAIPLLERLDAL